MSKVLRLHKGASNTIDNWGSSIKIGTKAIDSIPDPIGATATKEITSIPSPFARIDLVKRAFKIVAESSLDGNTTYHKLVSDCLDVGQIFFNIEKYRNQIEIIVWDKKNCLEQLSNSKYKEHQRLGKTYKTYIDQDSDEYNFNQMDCIYLLNYIDPTAHGVMNIIGATSPATLFFTSANDLKYVGEKIKFGDDCPFDSDYRPLYKRDLDYIRYWWSLKNSNPNFASMFQEVDSYLTKCYEKLTVEQREDLRENTKDNKYYENNYDAIPVTRGGQQYVTILGQKLRRKKDVEYIKSGFEMKISNALKKANVKTPLVLPVTTYTNPTLYVSANWDKNTKVPYFDPKPISERRLPDDGLKYPYITISDLLEDTILKIPYQFNKNGFFNGNDEKPEAKDSFILPIKKTYFDYFTVEDLMGKVDGKNRIEIQRLVGAVKVILRIPIQNNGYIQYERIYFKDGQADVKTNKGKIIGKEFTIGLYPSIKSYNITPCYRISFLDRDSVSGPDNRYVVKFYDNLNQQIKTDNIVRRNRNTDNTRFANVHIDSVTYALKESFQYMMIENEFDKDIHGVVIPKFSSKGGNRIFRFAIDFGTTNTHIEYSIDKGVTSKAFTITENDKQIQKLHNVPDNEIYIINVFNFDFIPDTIGDDSLYGYPMRTVLSESNNTNWSRAVLSMAHINIPFNYEKLKKLEYNDNYTDLKWSTNSDDKLRASKYIECLLLMLRNKVLLNNGDLKKTEIVWFYPASMTQSRYDRFKTVWENVYTNLFGGSLSNIISISESLAPYYYNKTKKGAISTVVSIDIGGGTTDVLIVEKGNPKYITSFKFAANTIFGDGYSYDSEKNGFINKYKNVIADKLQTNNLTTLKEVLNSVLEKKVSTNIIAFFFSLATNKEVQNKNIEINFNKMLADDNKGKYAILLFYVAIIYHIANMMKAKRLDMPRHITFSGNGSKILNILSTNDNTLINLTKLIFEQIYGRDYPIDGLEMIRPDNSKESTCKGGIIHFESQDYSMIKNMKTTLIGSNDNAFATETMTYNNISNSKLDDVVESVKQFIDFAFDLDNKFSFYDNFDIDCSIMDKVKQLCYKDIKIYLLEGLTMKKREIDQDGADENLEETLFFHPLVGIINAIVRNIYQL